MSHCGHPNCEYHDARRIREEFVNHVENLGTHELVEGEGDEEGHDREYHTQRDNRAGECVVPDLEHVTNNNRCRPLARAGLMECAGAP